MGRWVTLDDGQHVYIEKGQVMARGPSARGGDKGTAIKSQFAAESKRAARPKATSPPQTERPVDAAAAHAIGVKPGERFSLIQSSSVGAKGLENTGRGTTKFMFDMKQGDLPGQTSMFDRPGFAGKEHGERFGLGQRSASEQARLSLKQGASAEAKQTADGGKPPSERARDLLAARSKTAEKMSELKKVSDVQTHPEIHAKAGDVVKIGVGHVEFDPERFQYKINATGAHGVSSELHGVKNWNDESAGVISVWRDPANGKTFVVNGHHRLDLATRLGVEKVTARYIDAPDAATARAKGAITNIAEGRGTAIDAAKYFREAGVDRAKMDAHGLAMTESTARHGLNMAQLEPGLFRKVVNQEIPVERASIIGGSGLSHVQQIEVNSMAVKSRANNATLKELVDNAKASPTLKTSTRSLFGDDEEEKSLAVHRATVAANVGQSLSSDKKLFSLVSKSKSAEALEERGRSHIDVEETGKVSSEAAQVMGVFHTLKNRSGPVASELNRAAERLHAGESKATVLKDARQAITGHVKNILGGAAAFAA